MSWNSSTRIERKRACSRSRSSGCDARRSRASSWRSSKSSADSRAFAWAYRAANSPTGAHQKNIQEIYRQNDESVMAKRYQAMIEMFPDYPYLTKSAVLSFLEILRDEGKLKDPLNAEPFLDTSILAEVERERKK